MLKRLTRITFAVLILAIGCAAQSAVPGAEAEGNPGAIGVPMDWSFSHIVHSQVTDSEFERAARQEPRILYNWLIRNHPVKAFDETSIGADLPRGTQVDWSFPLGSGTVAPNMYPAKFGFSLTLANCTNDYVAFGLNVAGTASQPNLVRFNNIYAGAGGFCGALPTVETAYIINTKDNSGTQSLNGKLLTSPVLSLNGNRLAFIETVTGNTLTCPGLASNSTCSIFHVLTWGSTGDNGSFNTTTKLYSAVPPAGGSPANNAGITNLVYSSSTTTFSSPWVDYNVGDHSYFGDDNGKLYRTTCTFACAVGTTPQIDTGWPVTVAAGVKMSSPVHDLVSNKIFIGGSNGKLYVVDLAICPGALCVIGNITVGSTNAFGGIVDGPIVDSTFQTVFAFTGDIGNGAGTIFQTNTTLSSPNLAFHMGNAAFFNVLDGAFDDLYFNNAIGGSTVSGNIFDCGTVGGSGSPALYWVPFTKNAGNLSTSNPPKLNTASGSRVNIPGNPGIGCSPMTEFRNGSTDRLFFSQKSLPNNKCVSGQPADGCALMYDITNTSLIVNAPTAAAVEASGTSGMIIDGASAAPQASSIYFANQATTKCTTGTGGGTTASFCAVKLTQSALQ